MLTATGVSRRFPQLNAKDLEVISTPPARVAVEGRRCLGFDTYGPEDGWPLFWFHGSPSGRHEGLLLRDFAFDEGLRVIAMDRPGIGASDPNPGWNMLDFAGDVVRLADALHIERFSVGGGSGGGPFVLAMAYRAPDRIRDALSLACAGAFEFEDVGASAGWVDRVARWAITVPGLLTMSFTLGLGLLSKVPNSWAKAARFFAPNSDPYLPALLCRTIETSIAMGVSGEVEDTRVLHQPWGFALEEIKTPVSIVNGTKDAFIPVSYGQAIAGRIPGARLILAEGDGHFQTIYDLDRLRKLLRP